MDRSAWSDLLDRPALRRVPLVVDFSEPRATRDQLLCVSALDSYRGGVLAFNHRKLSTAAA
jgi:hypothetical protein